MPIKLNIGLNRKVGERHYGSRGASVGIEVTADADLVRDPPRLQQQLEHLFALAQKSVDQQLGICDTSAVDRPSDLDCTECEIGRPITARQKRALWSIARRLGLNLHAELKQRLNVESVDALSRIEASRLIGEWTAGGDGQAHQN